MEHSDDDAVLLHQVGSSLVDLIAERDRAAAALERLEAAVARKRAEDYLQQTYRDSLTGALQRDAGRDRLATELSRADRTRGEVVIAFLDVVGLKRINDEFGHGIGDLVLAAVGSALTGGLRAYDIVVRYGGDEFVCCMPGTSIAAAARRLKDVSDALAGSALAVDLSWGLALRGPGETLDHVIGRADRAMYESRAQQEQRVQLPADEEFSAQRG